MDYKTMEAAALEERLSQIVEEATEEKSLEELKAYEEEQRAIKAELEERKAAEAERRATAEAIVKGAGEVTETIESVEERKDMDNIEIRNTKAYIDAYANYIKTENDAECRALLTENVNGGTVPVPEFVYDVVKTAWERDEITRRVRKAYLKGNVKVGFEISSTGATKHTEGGNAVTEETLVLGTVAMIPASYKKWISISDEVYDMRGEEFLRYIYDELTYQIAKSVANDLLDKIMACGTAATTTQVAVGSIKATQIAVGLIASALGNLSDEAANPMVVMNKATWSAFKAAQYAASVPVDVFEGLPVAFSNHLKSFAAATTGDAYVIVGDFGHGALANFPNGEEITFKFDDQTLMTQDLIRILGREYVAIEPVASGAFVQIVK
ncbi:MAG: phage major capsid protein [Oscillospiraceae bacterium]|nr:phage major capsid protein [Oscillospiraceae bacterium]